MPACYLPVGASSPKHPIVPAEVLAGMAAEAAVAVGLGGEEAVGLAS